MNAKPGDMPEFHAGGGGALGEAVHGAVEEDGVDVSAAGACSAQNIVPCAGRWHAAHNAFPHTRQ